MAEITPNSKVILLRGVPLDKSYNHTINFATASAQYQAFYTKKKPATLTDNFELSAYMYQRAGKNTIKVGILADNLYDCNYMMFQNTSYGTKWFYAFIDEVEYINDNTSKIYYTIDVIQTWWFDFDLGGCFVEREHTLTDTAGDNIVPENLELGELVVNNTDEWETSYLLGGVITSKQLPNSYNFDGPYWIKINTQYKEGTTEAPAGVPNGLYISYGYPVDGGDNVDFWSVNNRYLNYDMQDITSYESDMTTPTSIQYPYVQTLQNLLMNISSGAFNHDGITYSEADIVDVFLYPSNISLNSAITSATALGYRDGVTYQEKTDIARPSQFINHVSDNSPYTPKNKKLLTYPYIRLMVSNNMGKNNEFKYEYFYTPSNPKFAFIGNYTQQSTVICLPLNYNGVAQNFENDLVLSKFPMPSYKGDQYTIWLESNRNSVVQTMISSAISGIALTGVGVATKSPYLAISGATSLANTVFGTLAKIQDLKNAPPTAQAQVICDVLNAGMNRTGFKFYHMTVRKEYAKMIDDYFSMFGYAIKQVKVPNIKQNVTLRPYWNYIKTNGCLVHPATNKGLPADAENELTKIFDKGITFWKDFASLGNYSLNNAPV